MLSEGQTHCAQLLVDCLRKCECKYLLLMTQGSKNFPTNRGIKWRAWHTTATRSECSEATCSNGWPKWKGFRVCWQDFIWKEKGKYPSSSALGEILNIQDRSSNLQNCIFFDSQAKKPLMEKMRRARINDSLNELKFLVLDALNKDVSIGLWSLFWSPAQVRECIDLSWLVVVSYKFFFFYPPGIALLENGKSWCLGNGSAAFARTEADGEKATR